MHFYHEIFAIGFWRFHCPKRKNDCNCIIVVTGEVLANAQLPALPQTAIQLLELAQDANNGPAEFAKPIEADPGLMGQILRFVNSSYFGFSREIASIPQALRRSGCSEPSRTLLFGARFQSGT